MPPITSKDLDHYDNTINTLANEVRKQGNSNVEILEKSNTTLKILHGLFEMIKQKSNEQLGRNDFSGLTGSIEKKLIELNSEILNKLPQKPKESFLKKYSTSIVIVVCTIFVFAFFNKKINNIEQEKKDSVKLKLIYQLSNKAYKKMYDKWDSSASKLSLYELEEKLNSLKK